MKAAARSIVRLRALPMFAGLGEQALQAVAERTVVRRLGAGQTLFRRGEDCHGLYVVLSGAIQIYRSSPADGREQLLHVQAQGQSVAEVPLFDGGPYPASARALAESEVLFLPRAAFEWLYLHHPELAHGIIRDLGGRLRRLISLLEKVSLQSVPARVAATVLERAEVAEALASGGSFTLGATQEQLARMLATTREGVARALAELRRGQVIEQKGARLRVLDPVRLAAWARGERA